MFENDFTYGGETDHPLKRTVVVNNQLGLHARPAARLAQEAQKFTCDLHLVCEEQSVDAKSILDILTLAAACGAKMELQARGEDAADALNHLEELFRRKFGEEK